MPIYSADVAAFVIRFISVLLLIFFIFFLLLLEGKQRKKIEGENSRVREVRAHADHVAARQPGFKGQGQGEGEARESRGRAKIQKSTEERLPDFNQSLVSARGEQPGQAV